MNRVNGRARRRRFAGARGWIGLAAAGLLSLLGPAAAIAAGAPAQVWKPGPSGTEVALWPDGLAIARPPTTGPESASAAESRVAGRPWTAIYNVTRPTMVIYRPKRANTGTTVVVFPGGGYQILAIDLEGTEVCDWLTARGVTCVVLKYRVPESGPHWDKACDCQKEPVAPMALQDAQRAIRLLRQRAAALKISPDRIGVLGFSAGGYLVADVSNHLQSAYPPVDEADRLSSRPDFAVALYPGHLWDERGLELHPRLKVDPHAPPTFLLQAQNDPVDDIRNSLVYFAALTKAKIPAEYHVYAEGGHAFGLRRTSAPITNWPALAETWMRTIHMLPPAR
jgi:acetyl esterase/lipase